MPKTVIDAPSEKAITRAIRDYLKTVSECVTYKQHGSAYALPGTPDFIGCYRGRFFAVEVKRPHYTSKLRPEQRRELDRICAAGGFGIVARSRDDVKRLFDYIDRSIAGNVVPDEFYDIRGY